MNTPEVKIYTKDSCPYCSRAIQFLENRDIAYEEIDLTGNQKEMDRIKQETGWMTMPIIIINGKMVGGYTDLVDLETSNRLGAMLGK